MDMPPSGWYPDPYGVPDLLRWWDGSSWTEHTHEGSSPQAPDPAGTSLDMTRAGDAAPGAGGIPGIAASTAVQRAVPDIRPTTVQPAVPADQPGAGSSWPGAGPGQPGKHPSWPGGPDGDGTRVLEVGEPAWTGPRGHGGHGGHGGRHGLPEDPRRRRMIMGGLLAGGTAVALTLIALIVSSLGSPAPPATTSARNTTVPSSASATSASAPPASATAPPSPSLSTVPGGVTDSISGLSYPLLSSPWAAGCPAGLSNQQTATWTAGESAVAGQVSSNGQQVNWYGEACSGPLPQQYGYNGVADLEPAAMNLLNAIDGPYYGALNHSRTQLASTPVSVSGHPGWEIKYLMTYPDAASQGLAWNSEEGAIVLADQGSGLPPAAFFVSVPSNLGVSTVDGLVAALTLSVTQQPGATQPGGAQPTTPPGNGNGGGDGGGSHP